MGVCALAETAAHSIRTRHSLWIRWVFFIAAQYSLSQVRAKRDATEGISSLLLYDLMSRAHKSRSHHSDRRRSASAQDANYCRQRSCLLSPARIEKKEAWERLAPIFEHAHERTRCEMRSYLVFRNKRKANSIERGAE